MEDPAQEIRALDIIDNFSSAIRVRAYQENGHATLSMSDLDYWTFVKMEFWSRCDG